MKQFLKNNMAVLGTYLIVLAVALGFLFSFDKKVIHLHLNSFVGNAFIDSFFKYITYLGDGTVAAFLILGILLYNFRLGLYSLSSLLTASFISIGLKHLFFDDENRPFFVFTYFENIKLKLVDGIQIFIHNSFPSGHSTQAFAIFMCLVFVSKKQGFKFLYLMLALLTAYSRVHLSQHWLADVTVGSIIGTLCSLLFYYVFIGAGKMERLSKPIYLFLRFWRRR